MTAWRDSFRSRASTLLPTVLAAAAGAVILLAPVSTENAAANGEARTIHLHHAHTKESIDATYMVDGRYDPVVLEKLNWFLRDWRRDEPTHMDPKLFDTIWEVYRESGSQQPIEVMSAYRSPETNSMLRHATRGVAEHSQHILGKAMDQHYMDVPMSRIRELAMRLQRGGVGFYPTAGTPFVHMDVGGVRHWPRMSYDQLSRLFPDGKTVHIPSNGQPLPGYEMARAELAARGDSFDYPTAGEVKSKGFFAWLFGGGDDDGDGEANRQGGVPRDAAPAPRRGGTRLASADNAPVGSVADSSADRHNGDRPELGGGGGSIFSLFSSKPAEPAPQAEPAPTQARTARGRAQVASLPPTQTADADAQAKLAAEMQRQAQAAAEAQKQAAAEAQKQAVEAQRRAAEERAAAAAQAQPAPQLAPVAPAVVAPAARTAPAVQQAAGDRAAPLPPRRPTELAAAAPALPARSADAAASRSDHAPTPGARQAVAAAVPPSARTGLPAAITQGVGQAAAAPHVLAFATPASAVPLPVARPPLVAARLDRSNFRSLTGATPADHLPARAGVGSSVAALRPAAQATAASLASDGGAPRRGFGARATDLSTGSFSGSATSPQERVSTAASRKRPAAAAADD
ncbi:DUF882 domain-containing protein [Lichenibacterium dinghuense]|uniref:DUF882 domain-containing protein n=1 Tax=Lichenibacterium dinghuense TaxID=2895977 RepID=UPI001F36E668|nr:DUF882 domain-containing protein [Lichenibacterium sp. 6Y81]